VTLNTHCQNPATAPAGQSLACLIFRKKITHCRDQLCTYVVRCVTLNQNKKECMVAAYMKNKSIASYILRRTCRHPRPRRTCAYVQKELACPSISYTWTHELACFPDKAHDRLRLATVPTWDTGTTKPWKWNLLHKQPEDFGLAMFIWPILF
jgi:hypothetical protein